MNRRIWFVVFVGTLLLPMAAMNGISNNPPEKPTINGPTSGEAGKEYTYTVVSTDPDGDRIRYCIDWGDGNEICSDFVASGQQVEFKHTWAEKGTYTLTVTATDEHGAESEPATLTVKMPYSKPIQRFRIIKPRNGVYIFGIKVMPIIGQIVIGDVNVRVSAPNYIERVEFYLLLTCGCGLAKMHVDTAPPFEWKWQGHLNNPEIKDYGMTWIFAKGYDSQNREYEDDIIVYRT